MADGHPVGGRFGDPGERVRASRSGRRRAGPFRWRREAAVVAAVRWRGDGGGHAGGGGGGGGRRSFGGGGGRSAISSGRSSNFRAVNRGTTSNRSVLRSQGLQRNTSTRTLRNTTAVQTNTQRALRRNGAAAITPLAARQGRFGLALRGASGRRSFRERRRAPGLAARPARRLRRMVRAGVLALRLFRHFRLRVLALRL